MAHNFLQFNPAKLNQETDDQYAADPLRSGGAAAGELCPSITFNKLMYQVTTLIKAFADALQAKGIELNDSNASTLAGLLANVVVSSDLTPYALLASPTFTGSPKAPTPPAGDSSQQVATTAWVSGQHSFASNGYAKLPSGLIIQWCEGSQASGDNTQTVGFPIQFPHACLHVQASTKNNSGTNIAKVWGVNSWNANGVTVQLMRRGDEGSFAVAPLILAFGY